MGGTLWLEAKAILGGSGPVCSARGLSGTGCGVRCSQPRAKPSDSYIPHLPTVTLRTKCKLGRTHTSGQPRRGSSPHSTTKSHSAFPQKRGRHGTPSAPAGWSACSVGMRTSGRSVRTLGAGLPLLWPLGASGPLRAQRALRRRLGLMGGWAQGRSRASGRGGRGTSVWAGVPGVGPGPGGRVAPPGFGSGAGLSQKTPVAVDR